MKMLTKSQQNTDNFVVPFALITNFKSVDKMSVIGLRWGVMDRILVADLSKAKIPKEK